MTDQEIQLAKERNQLHRNKYSRDKSQSWHGALSEIKFHQLYPDCTWNDTFEYDFTSKSNHTIDVKCNSGYKPWKTTDQLEILEHQKGFAVDYYVFTRYLHPTQSIEIYGAISRETFYRYASYDPSGSRTRGGHERTEGVYYITGDVFESNYISI